MRGKDSSSNSLLGSYGITPAYAGKSQVGSLFHKRIEDHPRLCGEKSIRFSGIAFAVGSPPPMRGKVLFFKELERDDGITPAYAGKSFTKGIFSTRAKDHPRLCGEKCVIRPDSAA